MESGRAAIESRIDEVLRIVSALVRREIIPGRHEIDDLIQDGVYGVLLNADRFDSKRGNISTFVTMTARHYLLGRVFVRDTCNKERVNVEAISLDAPVKRKRDNASTDEALIDLIADDCILEADVIRKMEAEQAYRAIDELDERTARVLRGRYGDEALLLGQLGAELGLSHERVRQIEQTGLRRVRRKMRA